MVPKLPAEVFDLVLELLFLDEPQAFIQRTRASFCRINRLAYKSLCVKLYESIELCAFVDSDLHASPLYDVRISKLVGTLRHTPAFGRLVTHLRLGGETLLSFPKSTLPSLPSLLPNVRVLALVGRRKTLSSWPLVDEAFWAAASLAWHNTIERLEFMYMPSVPSFAYTQWPNLRHLVIHDHTGPLYGLKLYTPPKERLLDYRRPRFRSIAERILKVTKQPQFSPAIQWKRPGSTNFPTQKLEILVVSAKAKDPQTLSLFIRKLRNESYGRNLVVFHAGSALLSWWRQFVQRSLFCASPHLKRLGMDFTQQCPFEYGWEMLEWLATEFDPAQDNTPPQLELISFDLHYGPSRNYLEAIPKVLRLDTVVHSTISTVVVTLRFNAWSIELDQMRHSASVALPLCQALDKVKVVRRPQPLDGVWEKNDPHGVFIDPT
ncbi:hypothetical protein DL96DRAFT_1624362, partial [Flagelloscypha sp. PMI_526]